VVWWHRFRVHASPAFDQPDDPDGLDRNGLILGDRAAVDEHRHRLWAVADLRDEVGVGCRRVDAHLVGGLVDDVNGHIHTAGTAVDR
jgi:hypothetical protein